MKLTPEQKARLKALLAIEATKRSAAEVTELADLQGKAVAAGYDPAEDENPLDEKQVEALITKSVTDALAAGKLTPEAIAEEVKKSLPQGKQLTADDVKTIVDAAVAKSAGTVDTKSLVAELAKSLPKAVNADDIKKIVEDGIRDHSRAGSKMQHQGEGFAYGIELPIAHRSGNLSVAQKQLLNACLMNMTDEVLDRCKSVRPRHMNEGIADTMLTEAKSRGMSMVKRVRNEAMMGGKAITSTTAGSGLELMNIDISSDLQMRLYIASQIAAAFVSNEIDMPSPTFPLPMSTTRPTFGGISAQGVSAVSSQPGTQNPILTAVKFMGIVPYSYEADEDAVVAILPWLQASLASGGADALEDALVNGDVSATHQDSDTQTSKAAGNIPAATLFSGFRKLAIAGGLNTDISTGGISSANIKNLRKVLNKYGLVPKDLLILCGPNAYNDLVALPETLAAYQVGQNNARILTGAAPNIYGIDIIPSGRVRENLNASAVYDGTTTTKGSFLIVHRPSWVMGTRQGFMIEIYKRPDLQQNQVIATFRRAFVPLETPSASGGTPIVVLGYNYTS